MYSHLGTLTENLGFEVSAEKIRTNTKIEMVT